MCEFQKKGNSKPIFFLFIANDWKREKEGKRKNAE